MPEICRFYGIIIRMFSIDKDWGCLEFNGGMVDIEPKILYKYCVKFRIILLDLFTYKSIF